MALTKVSTAVVDMSGNTGALEIAKGATTVAVAPIGTLRANTTTNKMEVYTSTGWQALKEGGNVLPDLAVDYLLVAGGGGGGAACGGGGGAGGLLTNVGGTSLTLARSVAYTVEVGTGGAGATNTPYPSGNPAVNGTDSKFVGPSSIPNIVSNGGGRGGHTASGGITPISAGSGGSGGGGSTYQFSPGSGPGGGATPAGQGNVGGSAGSPNNNSNTPGGGGGAAQPGTNGSPYTGGVGAPGGNGITNSITVSSGTGPYYAGGGGGGGFSGAAPAGGLGGGGNGGPSTGNLPTQGTNNLGGGGGGGPVNFASNPSGAVGGNGVVILRYPNIYQINFTAGASPAFSSSNATVGTDTVTTIIAGSGTITFSLTP